MIGARAADNALSSVIESLTCAGSVLIRGSTARGGERVEQYVRAGTALPHDRDRVIADTGWEYADATHIRLKRRAAVKVLATQHASDRMLVSRFFQEARIAAEIHHPNIVDVFDFVEQDTPPRIACVMELLYGPPLSEVLLSRRLTFTQALNATIQTRAACVEKH